MPDFKSKITKNIQEKIKRKEEKDMKKINWETVKTIIIAVLITGVVAFIGGMNYQAKQSDQVKAEAATIVKNVKVDATVAPSK